MENVRIEPAQERWCRSHNQTITAVAREGKYLSNNTGFDYDSILAFYRMCEANDFPQLYAINENDEAVGWCDIVPREQTGSHVGYIGVGLRPEYREKGIGTELMLRAMELAKQRGFTEIRLECRASNDRALHVYKKKLGFRVTGRRSRGMVVDGKPVAVVYMKKKLK